MSTTPATPQSEVPTLTRPEAIARLREKLKTYCDDEHCACSAAARFGLFCGGFKRFSDEELRNRFDWIVRTRPHVTREELERLVSLYHLSREEVRGAEVCCDVETREHCLCDGWNQFDNAALEKMYRSMTGREVAIR
jgi:hypothetical protein